DVAQSRITTDAYNSYRDYGTSEVLIQELERVAPELVRDAAGEDTPATLKRLSGGDGSPGDRSSYVNPPEGLPGNPDAADPLGTIGIGVTEKGELVAAMFSASGECWM